MLLRICHTHGRDNTHQCHMSWMFAAQFGKNRLHKILLHFRADRKNTKTASSEHSIIMTRTKLFGIIAVLINYSYCALRAFPESHWWRYLQQNWTFFYSDLKRSGRLESVRKERNRIWPCIGHQWGVFLAGVSSCAEAVSSCRQNTKISSMQEC